MAEEVKVSDEKVEGYAKTIEDISSNFTGSKLENEERDSTLRACSQVRLSYKNSQTIIQKLEESMETEVSNIRNVGATFKRYDEEMKSKLTEN